MNQHNISEQLFTIRDLLRFGISQFNQHQLYFGHGTDNAYDEVLTLILHSLHLSEVIDPEFLDARLLLEEKETILAHFDKRIATRIPAPYLINKAWFCGLPFYVDDRVLIPRSPMGELIQAYFKPFYQGATPTHILDLCTGSGCIGIACAYAFEDSQVVLSDISDDALAVAERNIIEHQLKNRVQTVKSNLFESIEGHFDIIVTNPPYVDAEDFSDMPDEFTHEPALALESGLLGLDHPLQILKTAANYLKDNGILIMEVGNSGAHLVSMFPDIDFNWVTFEKGGHGVFVISKYELETYHSIFYSI